MKKRMNISIGPSYEVMTKNTKELMKVVKQLQLYPYKVLTDSIMVLPYVGDRQVTEAMENDKHVCMYHKDSIIPDMWWSMEYNEQLIVN